MKLLSTIATLAFAFSLCPLCNVLSGGGGGNLVDITRCETGDAEDRQWCARLRIARMESQPAHVAVGEIPSDPNVSRVYNRPIIFASTDLYVWLSSSTYTLEGYGDGYRNSQKFYFLPTGRFFYKSTTYEGQTTPAGNVVAYWGRYRFTNEDGDEMEIETDAGESQTFQFRYGRRNLIFGSTTYGQVDWENEALRRQLGQL